MRRALGAAGRGLTTASRKEATDVATMGLWSWLHFSLSHVEEEKSGEGDGEVRVSESLPETAVVSRR